MDLYYSITFFENMTSPHAHTLHNSYILYWVKLSYCLFDGILICNKIINQSVFLILFPQVVISLKGE